MSPRPLQPLPSSDDIVRRVTGRVVTILLCVLMIYFYARTILDMLKEDDAGTK